MSMRTLATTVIDTSDAIVIKGGATTINVLSFVEDASGAGAAWMKGKRTLVEEDIDENLTLRRSERSLVRAEQAEAHRLKLEAFTAKVAARKTSAS